MTSTETSRVWLITGTSSGFGLHIAQAALERGDRVVATARRAESLDDLVASAPDRVLALALDVTRADQLGSAPAAALERFGRIDVLVNNAGYGSVGAVEEIDSADAVEAIRAAQDRRRADLEAWEQVSRGTAFDQVSAPS
jgi:NAD(P)-dependent dehydrogenase (short-subunit alcohol dehydrogenase family)